MTTSPPAPYVPVPDRVHRLLAAASGPQTAQQLADAAGASRLSAGRALRALENAGVAHRQPGGWSQAGRIPDLWTTARS